MGSNVDFPTTPDASTWVDPNHPCAEHVRIIDADKGLLERKRDKAAIIGYATSTRDMAPFDDPSYTLIGINQIYRFLPRIDVHADLHINWNDPDTNVPDVDHEGWIRDCGIPVLMTERHDHLPTSVRFPIEAILEDVGVDYFTSTVSLLLGWAIWMKFSEISLYGIDLVVGTEYAEQRASAEFLLGVAHGRGITIRLPPNCALLKARWRYGFEQGPSDAKLFNLTDAEKRKNILSQQREAMLTKMRAFDGAIHEVGRVQAELRDGPVTTVDVVLDQVGKRLKWLQDTRFETMMELATLDGALQESTFTHQVMELRSRGADINVG